jgi:hypothetical protein
MVKKIEKFYIEKWLPFTFNKKRILFVAILAYGSLC